jgi:TRAP-type C4-dicarboxylate transport system permease small subunit
MERWAMGAAALLAVLFAVFSVRLVMQSLEFHDISTGNDATPLWIPQLAMAVGTVILAVAAIDEFILEWHGRAEVQHSEALRHE